VVPPVADLSVASERLMSGDDNLRSRADAALAAGLCTDWPQRAYTSEAVSTVCQRLQGLVAGDLEAKLAVAGFLREPYVAPDDEDGIEQSCATCMYFERHRKFCALPELMLPVEPQWSCILWRI
jgi:hypothetical protein